MELGLVLRAYHTVVGARARRLLPMPSRVRRFHAVQNKAENEATYIEHVQSSRGVWGYAHSEKF